ncbi:MAG: hypothetical protein ABEJ58_06115, partial [Halodesulfurarchaeum sp.]
LPPQMLSTVSDRFRISGPYRNRTVTALPTLVPGEGVTIRGTVSNVGEATGSYRVVFTVDGNAVAVRTGSLEGSESIEFSIQYRVKSTGSKQFALDDWNRTVVVKPLAEPVVTDLSIPDGPFQSGSEVPVRVTVGNPAGRPATGTLTVRYGTNTVETLRTTLDANETVNRTVRVSVSESGPHRLQVGSRSLTITVESPSQELQQTQTTPGSETSSNTTTRTSSLTPTRTDAAGIGLTALVIIILSATGVIARRRWYS